jgi:uncharacterized protein YqgV (UPF0045/DUF77 family)
MLLKDEHGRINAEQGPLSHFQHTVFEKEDFFKLLKSINEAQGTAKQEDVRLKKIFDKFWDELETNVSAAVKIDSKPEKKRSVEDMLRELGHGDCKVYFMTLPPPRPPKK